MDLKSALTIISKWQKEFSDKHGRRATPKDIQEALADKHENIDLIEAHSFVASYKKSRGNQIQEKHPESTPSIDKAHAGVRGTGIPPNTHQSQHSLQGDGLQPYSSSHSASRNDDSSFETSPINSASSKDDMTSGVATAQSKVKLYSAVIVKKEDIKNDNDEKQVQHIRGKLVQDEAPVRKQRVLARTRRGISSSILESTSCDASLIMSETISDRSDVERKATVARLEPIIHGSIQLGRGNNTSPDSPQTSDATPLSARNPAALLSQDPSHLQSLEREEYAPSLGELFPKSGVNKVAYRKGNKIFRKRPLRYEKANMDESYFEGNSLQNMSMSDLLELQANDDPLVNKSDTFLDNILSEIQSESNTSDDPSGQSQTNKEASDIEVSALEHQGKSTAYYAERYRAISASKHSSSLLQEYTRYLPLGNQSGLYGQTYTQGAADVSQTDASIDSLQVLSDVLSLTKLATGSRSEVVCTSTIDHQTSDPSKENFTPVVVNDVNSDSVSNRRDAILGKPIAPVDLSTRHYHSHSLSTNASDIPATPRADDHHGILGLLDQVAFRSHATVTSLYESLHTTNVSQQSGTQSSALKLNSGSLDHDHAIPQALANTKQALRALPALGKNNKPLCTGHGIECIQRVVRKKGPNEGRKFYVCALGAISRAEAFRMSTQRNNPAARASYVASSESCGFFMWKDDITWRSIRKVLQDVAFQYKLKAAESELMGLSESDRRKKLAELRTEANTYEKMKAQETSFRKWSMGYNKSEMLDALRNRGYGSKISGEILVKSGIVLENSQENEGTIIAPATNVAANSDDDTNRSEEEDTSESSQSESEIDLQMTLVKKPRLRKQQLRDEFETSRSVSAVAPRTLSSLKKIDLILLLVYDDMLAWEERQQDIRRRNKRQKNQRTRRVFAGVSTDNLQRFETTMASASQGNALKVSNGPSDICYVKEDSLLSLEDNKGITPVDLDGIEFEASDAKLVDSDVDLDPEQVDSPSPFVGVSQHSKGPLPCQACDPVGYWLYKGLYEIFKFTSFRGEVGFICPRTLERVSPNSWNQCEVNLTPSEDAEKLSEAQRKPRDDKVEKSVSPHLLSKFTPITAQEWACRRVISGNRSLLILPTGEGKSLTYLLSTWAMRKWTTCPTYNPSFSFMKNMSSIELPGELCTCECHGERGSLTCLGPASARNPPPANCITLMVSPLLSLASDQYRALPRGINGVVLGGMHDGSSSSTSMSTALMSIQKGNIDILIVSPERVITPSFLNYLQSPLFPPLGLLVMDEAHVVTEWGSSFRPAFLRVPKLLLGERSTVHSVLAVTATATTEVRAQLLQILKIRPPQQKKTLAPSQWDLQASHRNIYGMDQDSGNGANPEETSIAPWNIKTCGGQWIQSSVPHSLHVTASFVGGASDMHNLWKLCSSTKNNSDNLLTTLDPSIAESNADWDLFNAVYEALDYAKRWNKRREEYYASLVDVNRASRRKVKVMRGSNDRSLIHPDYQSDMSLASKSPSFHDFSEANQNNALASFKSALDRISAQDMPCSIVFCNTQVEVEALASFLSGRGISCAPFHSQLGPKVRSKTEQKWRTGRVKVLVSTIAFGMGIDKRDVRVVLHAGLPRTLEEYTQQIGRGGRDGKGCLCHCFVRGTNDIASYMTILWQNKTHWRQLCAMLCLLQVCTLRVGLLHSASVSAQFVEAIHQLKKSSPNQTADSLLNSKYDYGYTGNLSNSCIYDQEHFQYRKVNGIVTLIIPYSVITRSTNLSKENVDMALSILETIDVLNVQPNTSAFLDITLLPEFFTVQSGAEVHPFSKWTHNQFSIQILYYALEALYYTKQRKSELESELSLNSSPSIRNSIGPSNGYKSDREPAPFIVTVDIAPVSPLSALHPTSIILDPTHLSRVGAVLGQSIEAEAQHSPWSNAYKSHGQKYPSSPNSLFADEIQSSMMHSNNRKQNVHIMKSRDASGNIVYRVAVIEFLQALGVVESTFRTMDLTASPKEGKSEICQPFSIRSMYSLLRPLCNQQLVSLTTLSPSIQISLHPESPLWIAAQTLFYGQSHEIVLDQSSTGHSSPDDPELSAQSAAASNIYSAPSPSAGECMQMGLCPSLHPILSELNNRAHIVYRENKRKGLEAWKILGWAGDNHEIPQFPPHFSWKSAMMEFTNTLETELVDPQRSGQSIESINLNTEVPPDLQLSPKRPHLSRVPDLIREYMLRTASEATNADCADTSSGDKAPDRHAANNVSGVNPDLVNSKNGFDNVPIFFPPLTADSRIRLVRDTVRIIADLQRALFPEELLTSSLFQAEEDASCTSTSPLEAEVGRDRSDLSHGNGPQGGGSAAVCFRLTNTPNQSMHLFHRAWNWAYPPLFLYDRWRRGMKLRKLGIMYSSPITVNSNNGSHETFVRPSFNRILHLKISTTHSAVRTHSSYRQMSYQCQLSYDRSESTKSSSVSSSRDQTSNTDFADSMMSYVLPLPSPQINSLSIAKVHLGVNSPLFQNKDMKSIIDPGTWGKWRGYSPYLIEQIAELGIRSFVDNLL